MSSSGYISVLYLIIAVVATVAAVCKTDPGRKRAFVFATVFTLFFGLGLAVGHGVMPLPGLLLAMLCILGRCGGMADSAATMLLFVALPMLIQWLLMLAIAYLVHRLWSRRQQRVVESGGSPVVGAIHKPILGGIWLAVGIIMLLSSSYFLWRLLAAGSPINALLIRSGAFLLLGMLQIVNGVVLLRDVSWSYWLSIPLSVLALPVFPFGTALGGYYLWYYVTIERQQSHTMASI